MDKVCFKLESENLYSEQMLVEYNDDPVFYICKSQTGRYYVVLCVDVEEGNYIVINSKISDVLLMLYGYITMRELYRKVDYFWQVFVGKVIDDDVVTKHNIEDIDTSVLPYEGEYYEILDKEVENYARKLENSLLNNKNKLLDESLEYIIEKSCKMLTKLVTNKDFVEDISECTEKLVDKLLNEQWNNVNEKVYDVKYDLSSYKETSLYSYIAA